MPEHVVFLVHGIGGQSYTTLDERPTHAWATSVIEAFDEAWNGLPKVNAGKKKRADFIDLVPITYDQVFHDYLEQFASYAEGLEKRLGDKLEDGAWKDFLKDTQDVAEEDAGFLWDSVFDVLLYRFGDFAEQVHDVIREQVIAKVREYWDEKRQRGTKFSIVSHSLGTAAAHAALHRLGAAPIKDSDAFTLKGEAFHFHTYLALANTCRLLWMAPADIYKETLIRPRVPGPSYVGTYINVRHLADPIPRPRAFVPRDWGNGYQALDVSHIHEANVHGFAHYLKHPQVVGRLVRSLLGDAFCTRAELDALPLIDVIAPDDARREAIVKVRAKVMAELDAQFGATDSVFKPAMRTIFSLVKSLVKARRALSDAGAEV